MADRIYRENFDFSLKTSPLGMLYFAYEQERDVQRDISEDTCAIYEAAWLWFATELDKFDADFFRFRNGEKRMSTGDRQKAEKRIFDTIKTIVHSKRKPNGSPYSPVTQNIYLRTMSTWFKWLVSEGVLTHDFNAEFCKARVREPEKSRTIMLPSQLDKFINIRTDHKKLNQSRAWTGGMLLVDTGMRIDELLELRLNDFEFKDSLIHIQHGKGDFARRVSMDSSIIGLLFKYKTRFLNSALTNPYFFGTQGGLKTMTDDNFRRDLQVLLRKAGIAGANGIKLTPHCFRHTAATAACINMGDIYKVKQKLGHKKIQTTEKYLHLVHELTSKDQEGASAISANSKYRQLSNN